VRTLIPLAGLLLFALPAAPADDPSEPALALQYDFYGVQGAVVPDGSGRGNDGTLSSGRIVQGRRKPAVQLDGTGAVAAELGGTDLAGRALTFGAMCKPAAPDGVLLSMGDAGDGFSLYLRGGVPHFAVRSNGALSDVAGDEPLELDRWAHVAAVIRPDGALSLLVNAFPVAEAAGPGLLARTPSGPLAVGADEGAQVLDATLPRWNGLVEDVRVYWGAVSREAHRDVLGDWANRPGCGCRDAAPIADAAR
jgi:hypothetical protein